jgi:uncharacterized coiled-coil DUF342 family protein
MADIPREKLLKEINELKFQLYDLHSKAVEAIIRRDEYHLRYMEYAQEIAMLEKRIKSLEVELRFYE